MRPGEETKEIIDRCAAADTIVRQYAAEHQIPQYEHGPTNTGGAPLVLVLAALIKDNAHLRMLINSLLEPVK